MISSMFSNTFNLQLLLSWPVTVCREDKQAGLHYSTLDRGFSAGSYPAGSAQTQLRKDNASLVHGHWPGRVYNVA